MGEVAHVAYTAWSIGSVGSCRLPAGPLRSIWHDQGGIASDFPPARVLAAAGNRHTYPETALKIVVDLRISGS